MKNKGLIEALQWRYAVKKFDNTKKIDAETIEQILISANLTATSLGLQAYKLVLLEGEAWKDKLQPITFGQESVQTCSHLLVLCARTDMDLSYIESYVHFMEKERGLEEGTMDEYVKVCEGFVNQMNAKEIDNWLAHQIYIVLGNLLTTCAILNVDSCPMEGFVPTKMDELLNLKEENLRSVVLLPIGIRSEDDPLVDLKKVRKPLDHIVIRR